MQRHDEILDRYHKVRLNFWACCALVICQWWGDFLISWGDFIFRVVPCSGVTSCQKGCERSSTRTSSVRRLRLGSVYRFFLPQCNGGFKLLWVCLCVRSYRVFWNLCLQIALEWLHDVARALFWGGSRSTKPCVFPCKVAAGDEERYLVCAAVAAGVGLSFFLPQCHGGFKLWVCLCVRSYRVFWNLCLQIALEWLHDVARALFWGGSRSTKPCVFLCKVAAGDDDCRSHWNGCMMLHGLCFGEEAGERNLVFLRVKWLQATMTGTSSVRRLRLGSVYRFFCRSVTVASSCFGCACVCVVIGCFGICACRSHWNGCMMLQGLCFGEEAGARNLVLFRVKWLQPAMKGTSSVRRLRLGSVYLFFLPQCNGGFKLLWVWLCVRSYRVFWHLWLQIPLKWLHDVAWAMFWGGSRSTKPCVFQCKVAAGDDERYLVCAAVAAAVGLSFFVCRSVTVASSCFGCACVCVVIGCFGICACRSHCNGCMMLHGLCFGEEAVLQLKIVNRIGVAASRLR